MTPMDAASGVDEGRQSVSPPSEVVNPVQPRRGSLSRLESNVREFEKVLVKYNLEIRGIQRVEEHEKIQISWLAYLQAFGLWVSINLAPPNITLGMLGPAVFGLSFRDASICAVCGAVIGSVPVAWIATWGALSGLRAMVG